MNFEFLFSTGLAYLRASPEEVDENVEDDTGRRITWMMIGLRYVRRKAIHAATGRFSISKLNRL